MHFIEEIKRYVPQNEPEAVEQDCMLKYIAIFSDSITKRENQLMHMTASSMIFNEKRDKVLMIYHKIYQSWAWTGGHADGETDLKAIAKKEAMEETGITALEELFPYAVALDILTVEHHRKKGLYIPAHIHLNVSYCFLASEQETLRINAEETEGVKWIPIAELKNHCKEEKMIPIYEKIIRYTNNR